MKRNTFFWTTRLSMRRSRRTAALERAGAANPAGEAVSVERSRGRISGGAGDGLGLFTFLPRRGQWTGTPSGCRHVWGGATRPKRLAIGRGPFPSIAGTPCRKGATPSSSIEHVQPVAGPGG